jgi:protocadherin-16/23
LDFETTQKYALVIGAQDKGSPPLRSNLTLNIEVQDVNDNPPTFEKDEYQVNVAESLAVNSQFLQVNAIDLDTGNNARLTYRVKEEALADVFGIFPNSGSLYLKKSLDREMRDRYTLTVVATDNGLPPGSAAATVNVFVNDANDNDPVFTRDVYQFTIEENLEKGALVGVVSATDKDLDANAALRYSLLPANGSFQLNSLTGTSRNIFHSIRWYLDLRNRRSILRLIPISRHSFDIHLSTR